MTPVLDQMTTGKMLPRLRIFIVLPCIFALAFFISSTLIIVQGREDIATEMRSADRVAASMSKLIELDRLNIQQAIDLQMRHIRISKLPPFAMQEVLEEREKGWIESLLTQSSMTPRIHSIELDPVQRWSVYASPDDEISEIKANLFLTLVLFLFAGTTSLGLIHLGITDLIKRIREFIKAIELIALDKPIAQFNYKGPIQEFRAIANSFNQISTALARAYHENTELSGHLIETQEIERRRLAHDLHDNLGQILAALRARVYLYKINKQRIENEAESQFLEDVSTELNHCHTIIRGVINSLEPLDLQAMNICELLTQLTQQWSRYNNICGDFEYVSDSESAFDADKDLKTTLYRITQEALNNVQKHSGATEAKVILTSNRELLSLQIRDNGCGGGYSKGGYGVRSMRERARSVGGNLTLKGTSGVGSEVHFYCHKNMDYSYELPHHR